MGKFSQALGLAGKGRVEVAVEKPYYVAGETIRGSVSLHVEEPFDCDKVVIRFKGKLKIMFTYDGKTYFWDTYEVVEKFVTLSEFKETMMPGAYSYPFEVQTDDDLPGSTRYREWNVKHQVQYKIDGTVQVGDKYCKELKVKKEVKIVENAKNLPAPEPVTVTEERDAKILWAFNKGKLIITAKIPKNVYKVDETVEMEFTVQNDSSLEIPKIRVRLMAQFDFHFRVIHETPALSVHKIELEGIAKHSTTTRTVSVPLSAIGDRRPSHHPKGQLDYHIKIENKIAMGKDPKLKLPLHIVPEPTISMLQPSEKDLAIGGSDVPVAQLADMDLSKGKSLE